MTWDPWTSVWTIGTPGSKFLNAVLVSPFRGVWEKAPGQTPAVALGAVVCIRLDNPPPELREMV